MFDFIHNCCISKSSIRLVFVFRLLIVLSGQLDNFPAYRTRTHHILTSTSNSDEWFHTGINCNNCAWPMSIAFSTSSVVADDFYRVSFTEASLLVREDTNWKIEWVVVNVPMALLPTGLQTWSKLDDYCIKETLWWYSIFKKQRSLRINFFMKCKRTMPFHDMPPCPVRYFHLI